MTLEDIVLRRLIEGQIGALTSSQIDIIEDWLQSRLGHSDAEMKRQRKALNDKLKVPR